MENKKSLGILEEKNILQYMILLLRPMLIGGVGALIWLLFHKRIAVTKEDEGIFESVFIVIGSIHGLLAALQVNTASNRNQRMEQAIHLKDKRMFDEHSCIRVKKGVKFLLGVFSLVFFFMFLLYPFKDSYSGTIAVWVVMFTLYLLWEIATELSDPFKGVSKITDEEYEEIFGKGTN